MSPEFKKMIGGRAMDSDGFGYEYGRYNDYHCRVRNKNKIRRCLRSDKRKVKHQEWMFEIRAEGL